MLNLGEDLRNLGLITRTSSRSISIRSASIESALNLNGRGTRSYTKIRASIYVLLRATFAMPTSSHTYSMKEESLTPKNTICLWFDKDAQDAARFYAATFPDSRVTAVHKAPGDYPSGKEGDVLTVEFTVLGIPCLGLNGGPEFKHNEAFSFQIATDNQEETDRYWNAIVSNGGKESACGWCKDRWSISWQITPRVLTEALAVGGAEAKRAFEAMMPMRKIDVAKIEAARRGR